MHLCDLSHTDPPACVAMSVCKGGRMPRACGYTRTRELTAGPRGACCGSLSATTVALLAHLSGAGGSQVLLHQHSDRSSVFSRVPVSCLCSSEQGSAAGAGFSLTGVEATPRTHLAASSSLCAALGRQSLSFALLNMLLLM